LISYRCLTELPCRRHQLIIVLLPKLPVARFQFGEDFLKLAAQWHWHAEHFAFIDNISAREVDFGRDLLPDVAQGALAFSGFLGRGERITGVVLYAS
jgi:hypothetical protein